MDERKTSVWAEIDFAFLGSARGVNLWLETEGEDSACHWMTAEEAQAFGERLIETAKQMRAYNDPESGGR